MINKTINYSALLKPIKEHFLKMGSEFEQTFPDVETLTPYKTRDYFISGIKENYPLSDTILNNLNSVKFERVVAEEQKSIFGTLKKDREMGESIGMYWDKKRKIKVIDKFGIKKRDEDDIKIGLHEVLHDYFSETSPMGKKTFGMGKPEATNAEFFGMKFHEEWDNASDNGKYDVLKFIDKILKENYKKLFDNEDYYGIANERFAWLGAIAGKEGLNSIPPELRKYYKDVFKGGSPTGLLGQ